MTDTWTLLIIDDCAADRKIYRRYLLSDPHQSYQILEADCAEDALVLCQEKHCDLILLDFCLPDMSGLELFAKLQQEIFDTPVAVIMLTGHGDEEVAVQAMKQGVQDYLVKQYLKPDVLQLAVRNAIKQSCLQAQLSKTRERQRLIATTALRIRQSLDLEQILNTAVAEIQQLLKCDRVMVYQFAKDIDGKIVAAYVDSSRNVAFNHHQQHISYEQRVSNAASQKIINQNAAILHQPSLSVSGGNLCQNNLWGCRQAFSHFYETDWKIPELSNEIKCYEQELHQFDSKSNLVVPINLSHNDQREAQIWGLLIAYHCSGERQWQTDDVDMLDEVSVQLAIAIQQAELLTQTQAALGKEKQLNALKSQIITTVSHEYRTPLTSIFAAASTLLQHGEQLDKSRQQRFLRIIEQKARYMSKLVDDMLLVNQLELDKTKFKPIPLDLLQFFSDLMEQERKTVGENHELIFKITGNCQSFWGDRQLLQQIFVNLMSNAIKYSPDGGNIEFHLIGQESQVIFHIQDEGIGIPIVDQEHLFQSFSRGSNVDTIPGTGLGLAITQACVKLHGGDIVLSSQVGQGTKVIVSLPKGSTRFG
ncbi:ATP-binding protein [Calothrix sp. PCC 7507]|uniref:hybrid sensor histidine kinase/response regulator n=1 Tax=Calothrix sp. PCC 7507 TaxID=99598 RepID=UPI0005AA5105|nr:ATP-binding protein [Calothrix sp. PCC 7507]